jgi:predicted dehydrogenase
MADCHLVSYRQAGYRPVAITSRTRRRAEEVAARHELSRVHDTVSALAADPEVDVIDVAVPPDEQRRVIETILSARGPQLRGILAQKPLGTCLAEAREIVALCESSGITLAVNQNMRFDPAVRTADAILKAGQLGEPVLATIEMRAIPHWMPWQERQGWVTLRIMSIHHLDTLRLWLGDPDRVFASIRPDPRTAKRFAHEDGIAMTILEYDGGPRALSLDDVYAGPIPEGAAGDLFIRWRIEGTDGILEGTVGWPKYPTREPSRLTAASIHAPGTRIESTWPDVWFPDAFAGPMGELLRALEQNQEPSISGAKNLITMAMVDACYQSAREHRAVGLMEGNGDVS